MSIPVCFDVLKMYSVPFIDFALISHSEKDGFRGKSRSIVSSQYAGTPGKA